MLKKIISGMQTGADIGSIKAAKVKGIATGGSIPKGFKTLNGPCPEYAELYGAVEHSSDKYPPRTYENVKSSNATLRFAVNYDSSGEICTKKAIDQYNRPYFDVHISNGNGKLVAKETPIEVAKWIFENKFETLNCAGNSERTAKGIEKFVQGFMEIVIVELRYREIFG